MSVNLSDFDQLAFPPDAPVVSAGKAGDEWEYDAAVAYFRGKRLVDVTYNDIRTRYGKTDWTASISFLSEQAFLFFLPALMKIAQDNYRDVSDNAGVLADNLVFMFRRMATGDMDHRLHPLVQRYSRVQLSAIAKFLIEMSDEHYRGTGDMDDAKTALQLFWGQYLET